MTIRLHDTLSGETRPLEPLEPGHVRIYSCGPTVYGPAHIGNFRSFLFADLLVRYLRYRGLRVTWVMNITDVDDKIIRGAAAAGVGIGELADRWLERFLADAAALRMTRPDVLPRATEHIDDMVGLIETLLEQGHAYRTDDGSIFFRIASWPAYGRLARLDPEQLRVGERVEADEYAQGRRPRLRALEGPEARRAVVGHRDRAGPAGLAHRVLGDVDEASRRVVRHPHRRHRPHLPAPRGRDRPERGGDRQAVRPDVAPLRPPPDERREDGEVDRQHRPGRRGARDGRRRPGAPLRAHRGPLPRAAQLHARLAGGGGAPPSTAWTRSSRRSRAYREDRPDDPTLPEALAAARTAFDAAIDDDLNVSAALAAVFDLVRELNRRIDGRALSTADAPRRSTWLRTTDAVLGVLPDEDDDLEPELRALLDDRVAARAARDWAASDRLRDELAARGIAVEDTRDGQRWRRLVEAGRG